MDYLGRGRMVGRDVNIMISFTILVRKEKEQETRPHGVRDSNSF